MPNCTNCSQQFEVTEADLKFYDKVSPVFNGKKYQIPAPEICPTCRSRMRLAYRNDRSLYHSKSDLSGKPLITMYHPDRGFKAYEYSEWWSDKWNALDYAQDFDFTRSFFEQFAELMKKVPRFNLFNSDTENCDYVNYTIQSVNCYLVFGSWLNNNCLYGQTLSECKDSIDCLFLVKSELCYECIDCNNCYNSFYCQSCNQASESYFCYDCHDVQNCIGCWNLRKKQYYILNQQVSKAEFEEERSKLSSYKTLEEKKDYFRKLIRERSIRKHYIGHNNENVSGDLIFGSKNAKNCFSLYDSQDVAFCARLLEQKDTYDYDGGGKGELVYNSMSNDFAYNSICCTTCEHLKHSHYCDLCFNCSDCFACIGLQRKQYCVFNKQYSKEDYEKLVGKIIEHMQKLGEWGVFFPTKLSPFAYNETMAQDYFPLNKEQVLHHAYKWQEDSETSAYQGPILELPDHIRDVSDDLVDKILVCEQCSKPYKIIKQELKFYKKMGLPVPHVCHTCRHQNRMALRNPRKLWDRNCAKCGKDIQTSYAPERPEIVYCEKCYLAEVY